MKLDLAEQLLIYRKKFPSIAYQNIINLLRDALALVWDYSSTRLLNKGGEKFDSFGRQIYID